MSKIDFKHGHASVEQFIKFMRDRHAIWIKRRKGLPRPWTDDPIFLDYKFTNIYRELDKGTIALRKMCEGKQDAELLVANIGWYRLFNRFEHATDIGWCESFEELEQKMMSVQASGKKIFTSAHMTSAVAWMTKLELYLDASQGMFENAASIADVANGSLSLEATFKRLKEELCVGSFIAYEMVSDYAWHEELLYHATDRLTWANIGPGCKRGLQRLGLPVHLSSLVKLHKRIAKKPEPFGFAMELPFELREIEHSLCEFDKYMRVLTGAGRPRQKFNGRSQ